MLLEYMKPKPRIMKIRYDDLARHISLIGAILYMMAVPPVSDIDPIAEEKRERREAKAERRAAKELIRVNKKEE